PRWASWNLGVFLCIRCGGFHRRIGTHISKVKSISLDNWTQSEIEHFRRIGNKRANDYFNPSPSRHRPPSSDSDLERFIRDKYERRRFVDGRNGVRDPTIVNASASLPDQPLSNQPLSPSAGADEASALTRLREMGFLNVRDNHAALKRFEFNVEAAAAYLRGESAPARPKISVTDPRVKQLLNMGFDHTGQNVLALTQCNGDVNQAIELLLSDKPPPRTSAALGTSARSSPPPAASTASNSLGALLGNMSLSSAATTNSPSSNDAFGDFGDFLSAEPTTRANAQPQTTATGRTSETLVASAASPPGHGGQSMFDNDFIMSLYSKAPAQTPAARTGPSQPSTASAPKPGASSSSAFGDLDFFM
ncbi:Gtpase activating protein, partial [Coemansia sp. S17]